MRGVIATLFTIVVLLAALAAAQEPVQVDPNGLSGGRYRIDLTRLNPQILTCYSKALEHSPQARGKIKVKVTITPSGDTQSVGIVDDTLGLADVTQCLVKLLTEQKWPTSNTTVFFFYTYAFAPTATAPTPGGA